MNKPKPDILKFLLRFITGALMLIILFSCFDYVCYRYRILSDLLTVSRCETREVELRLKLSEIYYEDEKARLRPPEPNTDFIKDGDSE